MLLDEPTNHLDVSAQIRVLDLLRSLTGEGVTVVTALHDLNLAARYADHLVAMQDGEIVAAGEPTDVLTAQLAEQRHHTRRVIHR